MFEFALDILPSPNIETTPTRLHLDAGGASGGRRRDFHPLALILLAPLCICDVLMLFVSFSGLELFLFGSLRGFPAGVSLGVWPLLYGSGSTRVDLSWGIPQSVFVHIHRVSPTCFMYPAILNTGKVPPSFKAVTIPSSGSVTHKTDPPPYSSLAVSGLQLLPTLLLPTPPHSTLLSPEQRMKTALSGSPDLDCLSPNGRSLLDAFDRRRALGLGHLLDMDLMGLTSPIRVQGISKSYPSCLKSSQSFHLSVDSPRPPLSPYASFLRSVSPPCLWRCYSISITVLLFCGAVRLGPEDAAEFVSTSFQGADWISTSQLKVTISLLSDHVGKTILTNSNIVLSSLSLSSFEDLSLLSYDVVFYAFNQRGWTIPFILCNQAS